MKQSELFTKSFRTFPADEEAQGMRFLVRAGFVHKVMAGVYEYLPLGFRVLKKIEQIIREEMNAIGGQELLLSTLQDKTVWQKSGRWEDKVLDVWFKTKLKNDSELGLAATHEEPLTYLMKSYISSYRDLPIFVYQFQTKFRNEIRAKSGILRTREFLMKDLYSFTDSEVQHRAFYEKAKGAYLKVFSRVGLGDKTFLTFASGGTFSKYSHEFQTIAPVGEDTIYLDRKKGLAVNKEVLREEILADLGLKRGDLEEVKAVEVGNIFSLGARFSTDFNLMFKDQNEELKPVIMGSYGIGPGRLAGTIAEVFHDERGIVWPKTVAPFQVHLLELEKALGRKLYGDLQKAEIEVLYDDRKISAGEKFAEADLIGIPWRLVLSKKTGKKVEVKIRSEKNVKLADVKGVLRLLKNKG
ncbi:MAG: prolyl-tRNA synthetase [Candidatus Liptonbacteria bacterium]|nr:prolyl-tRNA synthetase [Candidatus Liptonbacteria bacterium]